MPSLLESGVLVLILVALSSFAWGGATSCAVPACIGSSRWPSSALSGELRRMQMIAEAGAENNSTTVRMFQSDFVSLAQNLNDHLCKLSVQARVAQRRSS